MKPAQRKRSSYGGSKGMTLIEVLASIGIVASLLVLAAPAIERARESAAEIQCMNRLRHAGIFMQNHIDQQGGRMPSFSYQMSEGGTASSGSGGSTPTASSGGQSTAFGAAAMSGGDGGDQSSDAGSGSANTGGTDGFHLWSRNRSAQEAGWSSFKESVWVDPSDRDPDPMRIGGKKRAVSYAYNVNLMRCGGRYDQLGQKQAYSEITAVYDGFGQLNPLTRVAPHVGSDNPNLPKDTSAMVDGEFPAADSRHYRSGGHFIGESAASRHQSGGSGNVLYADWHVEAEESITEAYSPACEQVKDETPSRQEMDGTTVATGPGFGPGGSGDAGSGAGSGPSDSPDGSTGGDGASDDGSTGGTGNGSDSSGSSDSSTGGDGASDDGSTGGTGNGSDSSGSSDGSTGGDGASDDGSTGGTGNGSDSSGSSDGSTGGDGASDDGSTGGTGNGSDSSGSSDSSTGGDGASDGGSTGGTGNGSDSSGSSDGSTGGDDASADDSASDGGRSNNGHGNNADGVDTSNPGQGQSGPTGANNSGNDPSGDVDDEAQGGGALPSKGSDNGGGQGSSEPADGDPFSEEDVGVEDDKVVPKKTYTAKVEIVGTAITYGGYYDIPVTTQLQVEGQTFEPFGGYDAPASGGAVSSGDRHELTGPYSAGTPLKVKARSWIKRAFYASGDRDSHWRQHMESSTGQATVLKSGADVPDIDGFQDQGSVASFLQPYVSDGKIQLESHQAIYLFELGERASASNAYDMQDLVALVSVFHASEDATGGNNGGSGRNNNGHGNNADGVDTSNPGNAPFEDTNPDVDDEAGGGGAQPSRDGGGGGGNDASSGGGTAETDASFAANNRSVTATSTKDLSNVVLELDSGRHVKYEGLSGERGNFTSPGGDKIRGIWIKSGSNASGDGPGYGEYHANPNM